MSDLKKVNIFMNNYILGKEISKISLDGLVYNIKSETDTSDATATEDDILLGKTAYVNASKITGKMSDILCFHSRANDWHDNDNIYRPCLFTLDFINNKFFEYTEIPNVKYPEANKQLLCKVSGYYNFFIVNYATLYSISFKFKVLVNDIIKIEGIGYNDTSSDEKSFFGLTLNDGDKISFWSTDNTSSYTSGRSICIYYTTNEK